MKNLFWLIILFCSTPCWATTVILEQKSAKGIQQMSLKFEKETLLMVTNTDAFQKALFGLGQFTRKATSYDKSVLNMISQHKKRESTKLKYDKKFQQRLGTRASAKSNKNPHSTKIFIDNFEIPRDSKHFQMIQTQAIRLANMPKWNCKNCIQFKKVKKSWKYKKQNSNKWKTPDLKLCENRKAYLDCAFPKFGHAEIPLPTQLKPSLKKKPQTQPKKFKKKTSS